MENPIWKNNYDAVAKGRHHALPPQPLCHWNAVKIPAFP